MGPRAGLDVAKKNSQPLPGLEPPIRQPVAECYTTDLSLLIIIIIIIIIRCSDDALHITGR
jgi:hypothetical protein